MGLKAVNCQSRDPLAEKQVAALSKGDALARRCGLAARQTDWAKIDVRLVVEATPRVCV